MYSTPLEEKIRADIEPSLDGMGYDIVLVRLKEGRSKTLEIVAERKDGRDMSVDDCADISYSVSALMDVKDPIQGAYQLEVSSPGMDRPLVALKDFERFAGHVAKLETQLPVEGRKRFKGMLKGVKDRDVSIEVEGTLHALDYDNLRSAKLVLTDELVKEALKKKKA